MISHFKRLGCHVYGINSVDDHIHIVHSLPRTVTLAKVLEDVKKFSSGWAKKQGHRFHWFAWQDGYSSYSADYRKLEGLLAYVRNQREHHGYQGERMTFVQEYSTLLTAYHFEFKPEYQFPERPDDQILREPVWQDLPIGVLLGS
jgi:hypothetical protein